MHFDQRDIGDYRIYAGALEAPRGDGYMAAVVVSRVRGTERGPREAYRDTAIAGGHRWLTPNEAINYAFARATELIRSQPQKLAC